MLISFSARINIPFHKNTKLGTILSNHFLSRVLILSITALGSIACDNSEPLTTPQAAQKALNNEGSMSAPKDASVNLSATYYVAQNLFAKNTNKGSKNQPWASLQYAADQLKAGDTLVINAGTYSEMVLLTAQHSGTAQSPIRIISKGAVISGEGLKPKGTQGLITLRGARHIHIDGFELKDFKTEKGFEIDNTPVGLLIEGASSHIMVKNNKIHHIENLSTCTQSDDCGPGANGIAVYGNTQLPISNLIFENNEVSHCILASSEAFTLNGNIDGFKLINNYVHDNNNIGIDIIGYEQTCEDCVEALDRARNGIVVGNRAINNSTNLPLGEFKHNPWYEGEDGSAGGFYVDGGHNIFFDSNISSGNDLGFEFASEHPHKSTEEILMVNNAISFNREVGLTIGGYGKDENEEGGGNAKQLYIYNNSFFQNKGWGSEIVFAHRVSNTHIANNIFSGAGDVNDNFEAEQKGYQNIRWENNLWWASGDTSDSSSLPNGALVKNPFLTLPEKGDFSLYKGSPAINKAVKQADLKWKSEFWQKEFPNGKIPSQGLKPIERFDIGKNGTK